VASALATVSQYIARARVLLQDTAVGAYRYSDAEMADAINSAMLEIRRIRPDLMSSTFSTGDIPFYDSIAPDDVVDIDPQYRMAILYYIVGHVSLRDDENTQDARATVFLNKFVAQLLTTQS
jgi:hypothetical protein